jgi:hypothetical protein
MFFVTLSDFHHALTESAWRSLKWTLSHLPHFVTATAVTEIGLKMGHLHAHATVEFDTEIRWLDMYVPLAHALDKLGWMRCVLGLWVRALSRHSLKATVRLAVGP